MPRVEMVKASFRWMHERGADSVVLVAAGVLVALLGVLGVAQLELLTSVAIALLSAVAALLLRADNRETEVAAKTDALVDCLDSVQQSLVSNGERGEPLSFEYPDLTDLIESSIEADVVAGLALNVSNQYHGKWREGLARGLRLRLICPDPADAGVVSQALFRSVFREAPTDVSGDVEAQINFARALADAGGSLELKTIPYLPPFGILRFAGLGASDVIFVKLMACKVGAGQYPVLRISRDSSPEWFEYFASQIELYLEHGSEVFED